MAYQAFYRVYRPQSFREMSGQSHVKRTLQNALLADKTTHAYLFSGPRGTGKTSTAKIFAKALNCEHAPTDEPCNECATCKSITNGSHPDVIEFDAASNSKVEEMREIIEKVRFAPASARYKVYIIDEVHMLSTSAFNALLKTLEEPPAHVVFILATTEPHKIPATIISRCQRFDFKRLSSNDILERMKIVLEDIALPYDEQALKVIAKSAAGGMRDALSMLDQVVSFSGESLTLDDALFVTGSISQDIFYELAQSLADKDVAKVLAMLEQLMDEGKDAVRLSEDLITFFRDLLLIQTAPDLGDLLELATTDEKFKSLANNFSMDTLYSYIDILSKTQQEMRLSLHSKVYLETALLKMSQSQSVIPTNTGTFSDVSIPEVAELQSKLTVLETLVHQMQQGDHVVQQQAPPKQRQHAKLTSKFNVPVGRIQEVLKVATKRDIQTVKNAWVDVLHQLPKSQSALLEDSEPVAASESAFVIKFKYEIHCQMAADNKELVSNFVQYMAGVTGKIYDIVFVPENSWQKIRTDFIQHHNMDRKSEHEETVGEQTSEVVQSILVEEQQSSEDPLVSEAEKLFGKDFVKIEE
ncbi:DNA polymerase III subunit gamma/tau [Rummeliibacillus sp. POC4]|uniref:DNA polymerase III subunit gamma/tau n=1 Tax=Rummeliibacillus sp. POC4 TaxID=2305899 RepID=UPI000E662CA9|nr:DNA polymerase III subunit gamma/tau [Rummeliibacillus sp. POC4]RIJ63278.1 DNA polymerase III subunit gamma/tau [Rummeliibacillus sp. POC4]